MRPTATALTQTHTSRRATIVLIAGLSHDSQALSTTPNGSSAPERSTSAWLRVPLEPPTTRHRAWHSVKRHPCAISFESPDVRGPPQYPPVDRVIERPDPVAGWPISDSIARSYLHGTDTQVADEPVPLVARHHRTLGDCKVVPLALVHIEVRADIDTNTRERLRIALSSGRRRRAPVSMVAQLRRTLPTPVRPSSLAHRA